MTLRNMILPFVAAGLLFGCGQADSAKPKNDPSSTTSSQGGDATDPHEAHLTEKDIENLRKQNETYAEAIDHIRSYRDTIRDETTGGNPDKAHQPLDKLDYVLQWLPEIAQKSGIPKSKWEEVNTTGQKLRDLFNKIHANIDAGKESDYKAVADEIDSSIESIAAIKPSEEQ